MSRCRAFPLRLIARRSAEEIPMADIPISRRKFPFDDCCCIRIAHPCRRWAHKSWFNSAAASPLPISPRARINFNLNWKFIRRGLVAGRRLPDFDDFQWMIISTPHRLQRRRHTIQKDHLSQRRRPWDYKGLSWYRKHFKLPAGFSGRKIFLEFEGMRQAEISSSWESGRVV